MCVCVCMWCKKPGHGRFPLTMTVSPSTLTTLVQLSMPVVAVWYSSNVLSFSLRKSDVFPTPSSPSNTTLYVGPRVGAAIAHSFPGRPNYRTSALVSLEMAETVVQARGFLQSES